MRPDLLAIYEGQKRSSESMKLTQNTVRQLLCLSNVTIVDSESWEDTYNNGILQSTGEEGRSTGEEGRSTGEEGRSTGEEGRSTGEERRSTGEERRSTGEEGRAHTGSTESSSLH